MIEAIRLLDRKAEKIFTDRPAEAKMMASSSHFAALAVSILRAKGIPARKRAGFVPSGEFFKEYGIEGKFMSYDIAEYYDHGEWKVMDVPGRGEGFISAARAYTDCRNGAADPSLFFDDENSGFDVVIAVLVHDLDACAKNEMLTWDRYGICDADKSAGDLSDADWALLDKAADLLLTDDKDIDAIDALYKAEKSLRVPRVIFCDTPLLPPHKMVTRVVE